ncbi:OmpA family protein [Caenispirillum bisanense]|uniref:OmpA family protein n=1 Tax=Caenispirillum bisanense TaxID=414052 RepID=A0A286GAT9_9PROT|nr:OmpA family protein [Caenispirillum bisanense]SOD92627.1 OmpA family protein [Caenispirillum bisanense]
MTVKPILFAAAAVALLGACTTWDLEKTRAMAPAGDTFTQALKTAYLERAAFEKAEQDWGDVAYFNMQARTAAAGQVPPVGELASRGLSAPALAAGRAALLERLATAAPSNTPEACAQAQAWFEHWMEQEEEGHQPDHIAEAKGQYDAWLAKCQPPVMAAEPADFIIYFPFDSATLTATAKAEIARAAEAYKTRSGAITLTAHTDTAGDKMYNQRLSERRADAVRKALVDMGVPSKVIAASAYGENMTAVATGDGVEKTENRRVTITVGAGS